jgi:hypothetical protein
MPAKLATPAQHTAADSRRNPLLPTRWAAGAAASETISAILGATAKKRK